MRFAFIDAWQYQWRVATLCRVMRARQRTWLSILADTPDQHACAD
jgi:hypothetical protein